MYKIPENLGSVEDLIKRFAAAKEVRGRWDSLLRDCYKFAAPKRDTLSGQAVGQKREPDIVDSTAELGVQRFASRLQAMLVPPWREWIKLVPGSDIPEENQDEAQAYLDTVSEKLFDHLNHSNFASQAHEAFTDLAISTGALTIERSDSDSSLLAFNAVPLSELVPEEGPRGTVDTVWREHEVSVRNIERLWPDADLSAHCKQLLTDKPDTKVAIIEGTVYDPKTEKYYQCCIEKAHSHVVYAQNFNVSPWVVFRESVRPGEVLGRGRVMTVLSDIKMLNQQKMWQIKNIGLQTAGVYTAADDGVINPWTVRIEPGAIIPVGSNESSNPTLRPLPMPGNPQLEQHSIDELRKGINRALFAEPFGDVDAPVRTATEMSLRNQELMQDSGAAFSRLQTEFIEKIIKRSVDILIEEGEIQPVKIDGRAVTIKHTSPLAKVQDQDELAALRTLLESGAAFGNELMAGSIVMEEVLPWIAKKLGVDNELIRTKEQREAYKQAMMQQVKQQQMMEEHRMEQEVAQAEQPSVQ
jgi:hypothetical protein